MSRTTLIDLFRHAFKLTQIAHRSNRPIADIEPLLKQAVSRRRVLQTGIAFAGLMGMRPGLGVPIATLNPDSKVLVVGAGIAGLTAAYRLHQAGVPVDVVEAANTVGGRLRSFKVDPNANSIVELGGEFIDTRHTAVRSLASELGLTLADLKAADVGLEPEILYFQGNRISRDRIIEEFAPLAQRIVQDLTTLGSRDVTYQSPSPHAIQLDRLSLTEYLDTVDISPVINQLVKVAYVTEYGRDADSQSCLNMLFLIGTELGKWDTYGVSDERWHVVGGNDQIPHTLAQKLNGSIETGLALESIRTAPDGRYRVSLRQGNSSVERTYERILLTLPFSVLRFVDLAVDLPPVKRQAIAELGYGTSSKLVTPYRERIWRTRYSSTISVYTDLDFQNTWESARYTEGVGGWLTDLRGGTEGIKLSSGEPEQHAQALATNLEALFPGITQVQRGRSLRAVWSAEPYAFGSYSCYLPGQWTALAGSEGERVGNIWFAGEHCSLGSQGYMNGACETAETAAASILQDMNVKVA
ncbi:MAG: FAD-dependent oxidoreductase [Oculatellaceae cyanobacterium bins.114]|nr:FAD-dependent oxidoreductase [Oculatellaceae cyanobacterium bins.114]